MKKNMGNTDRTIRLIIAAILITLYFSGMVNGTLGIIALGIAVVFSLTSIFSFCPLYTLIRVSTCTNPNTK